ncbi:MAG: matrixin family metalloprotease [Dehalococcoidia bacterium]|nr:matrixin family metalloprotease [Dehalococcoidia bacterium]
MHVGRGGTGYGLARRLMVTAVLGGAFAALATWTWTATPEAAGASWGPVVREASLTLAVEAGGAQHTVAVDFLIVDDGTGRFDADVQQARDAMLSRFPGAIALEDGGVRAQYDLNGYWWPTHSLVWSYNAAGKPAGLIGDESALVGAAATWTASGANVALDGGAATTANTGACSGRGIDGHNTVGWAPQGGNTLAVTCTWYSGSASPKTATEFDMQIDPGWHWTAGNALDVDLQSVVTHEFGHAIGLAHSPDAKAVMSATYVIGTNKRALTADDVAGAVALYGAAAARPPAPSPTTGPNALPLLSGANLLTWPGATVPPAPALGAQGAVLRMVYAWNAETGEWQRYGPGLPGYASNLKELRQGQAYWFIASGVAQIPFSP